MSLADKAMLVTFSCSQWSGRKQDKEATDKVASDFSASEGWGRYNKLLVSKDSLKKVGKVVNEARTFYYENTLPWGKEGSRMLPSANFQKFSDFMRRFRNSFENSVDDFVADYDNMILEAQSNLGSMFKRMDYPSDNEIRDKFQFSIVVDPIPDSNDFRLKLSNDEEERIKKHITERVMQAQEIANKDLWNRLHTVIKHMVDKLSDPETIFRDSLVNNAVELCNLLPALNINNDQELEKVRKEVEDTLCQYNPEDLRKNTLIRKEAENKAREILKNMSGSSPFDWGTISQIKAA